MKKIALVALVALFAFSCKKDKVDNKLVAE
jgi:hypothetical protein